MRIAADIALAQLAVTAKHRDQPAGSAFCLRPTERENTGRRRSRLAEPVRCRAVKAGRRDGVPAIIVDGDLPRVPPERNGSERNCRLKAAAIFSAPYRLISVSTIACSSSRGASARAGSAGDALVVAASTSSADGGFCPGGVIRAFSTAARPWAGIHGHDQRAHAFLAGATGPAAGDAAACRNWSAGRAWITSSRPGRSIPAPQRRSRCTRGRGRRAWPAVRGYVRFC